MSSIQQQVIDEGRGAQWIPCAPILECERCRSVHRTAADEYGPERCAVCGCEDVQNFTPVVLGAPPECD